MTATITYEKGEEKDDGNDSDEEDCTATTAAPPPQAAGPTLPLQRLLRQWQQWRQDGIVACGGAWWPKPLDAIIDACFFVLF
jgi:hypothetical protein